VEVLDGARIGRVHGAKANSYTAGVICEKVGRYAERIHHEGIWPGRDFEGGLGINTLVGDDPIPPFGGGAFHDTAVWLRREGGPTR
jgi:hypothetical protein